MHTKSYLLIVFVLLRLHVFSQVIQNEIIVPPNLTANKLENCNIDKPNLYSGTVDDNIPIYEIKIKNFSFPIVLNHNYNGFKPAESASWVGLGWNLRVGGSVSCVVNNRPDEDVYGYNYVSAMLNIPDPVNDLAGFNSLVTNLTENQLKNFANGTWEGLPDYYTVSTNNISARFIKLRSGKFVTIPFKPIEINNPETDQWNMKDESGNKYYFGNLTGDQSGIEGSTSTTLSNGGEQVTSYNQSKYILRKIELITGETILFNYEYESVLYDVTVSETKYCSTSDQPFERTNTTSTLHGFSRLASIATPYETIYFKKGVLRKDLNSADSYPLGEIEVKNVAETTIKRWLFYTSYMGLTTNYSTCRLMLDSIVELGSTPTLRKPAYSFNYEKNIVIPAYTSKSIDHWGYYNGANNETLIPQSIPNSSNNIFFLTGADREPNHNYSKIGLLTEVILPTKGNLNYQYEPNNYGYVNSSPVNEIIYDSQPIEAKAIGNGDILTVLKSFTITQAQYVNIEYSIDATTIADQDFPSLRLTQNLNSPSIFSKSNSTTQAVSGSEIKHLTPGTYYIESTAMHTGQVVSIAVTYTTTRKDANGNILYLKNKFTGGHRVTQLAKQEGSNNANDITQTMSYTCNDDPNRSSGVLINEPDYEYNYSKMNIDNNSHRLADTYYIARTSNSVRAIVSDDSHINYSVVTSITNQNIKNAYYFTSSLNFQDYIFPRNVFNISKSYKRGLLTKEIQYNNIEQASKVSDYNYNFSRAENKSGVGSIHILDYQHVPTIPSTITYQGPWFGQIVSEWIPLESTVEQTDGVTTTNNLYYDNPVHAQVTRTKVDNTEETYTYTLYPDDYSNTGNGDFIGEMKTAHILNKPIEKITYVKDKVSGNLFIVAGEVYTYKTGVHLGQIESIYKLNTKNPILVSSFKFSNRANAGEMPHATTAFAAFSLTGIDAHYSTEPEQKVISYGTYNNPGEFWSKNNISITYLWSYNHQYPIAEIKNASYSDVKLALGYSDAQIETLAANSNPNVSEIRDKLTAYFNNRNGLVSTYTYKPLVGILTATDSRGTTTFYNYDDFNRMKEGYIIENGEKKILQKFDYHYANQQ